MEGDKELNPNEDETFFFAPSLIMTGYLGSCDSLMGAASWLLSGRKLKNSRMLSRASTSSSKA